MEVKPKTSRNLILVVILIFSILGGITYSLLSSEKLFSGLLYFAIEKFVANERLSIDFRNVEGCLLTEIKIDRVDVKHVKPNFDARIKDITINIFRLN